MRKILSIDGGGIRGVIPALVLAEIERRTGRPTHQLFDLIAGTSTGGILALGLAHRGDRDTARFTAHDLVLLYEERGPEIFPRSIWRKVTTLKGLRRTRYPHEPLESILEEYFGHSPLNSALTDVLVSTYDIQNREPFFFKSWREETGTVEMRQIARATSAAPTYFEPALVSVRGGMRALVDGGVFVNNPAVSAYAEIMRRFPDDELLVVSLATGALTRPIAYDDARKWGVLRWASPVLQVVFDGVSDAVDYQMRHLLSGNFYRFQAALDIASDDMDDTSPENMEKLRREATRLIQTHEKSLDEAIDRLTAASPVDAIP